MVKKSVFRLHWQLLLFVSWHIACDYTITITNSVETEDTDCYICQMWSVVKIGFKNQIGFVRTKPETIFWDHNERFFSQISIAQYGALWWVFCHAVNEDKLFQFCWGTRLNINITPAPPGGGRPYTGGGTITGSTPHCPAFICTISRFFPFFDIFMAVFFSPRSYNSFFSVFSYPNVSLICTFLAFPITSFSESVL